MYPWAQILFLFWVFNSLRTRRFHNITNNTTPPWPQLILLTPQIIPVCPRGWFFCKLLRSVTCQSWKMQTLPNTTKRFNINAGWPMNNNPILRNHRSFHCPKHPVSIQSPFFVVSVEPSINTVMTKGTNNEHHQYENETIHYQQTLYWCFCIPISSRYTTRRHHNIPSHQPGNNTIGSPYHNVNISHVTLPTFATVEYRTGSSRSLLQQNGHPSKVSPIFILNLLLTMTWNFYF